MRKIVLFLIVLFSSIILYSCKTNPTVLNTTFTSEKTSSQTTVTTNPQEIKQKVEQYINNMTLEQKVGQMMMPEKNSVTLQEIRSYNIGTVLSGAGQNPVNTPYIVWADIYNNLQKNALLSETKIPLLYGIDAVHGNNAVYGATLFPHNIGLGAANDADLMYRIGEVTAEEMAKTGVNWNFSPTVAVVQNIQWGRTYESFGENPEIHTNLVEKYVQGLQQFDRVSTAKHFIGDGGTDLRDHTGGDWSIDQGNVSIPFSELSRIHLPGYIEAIESGVSSVMISYSSFYGIKMHQNKELITDLLKEELGFDGIVVSDYDAIKQIPNADYYHQLVLAVNAGIDVLMEPHTWKTAYNNIIQAVSNGDIPIERINDAVSRILTVKYKHNIFANPLVEKGTDKLSTEEHKAVAREAVRKSLVLLKNDNDLLPLEKNSNVLLLGPGANNLILQNGGWTVRWQGPHENDNIEGTSILSGFQNNVLNSGGNIYTNLSDASLASVAVVVLAETPYAEGQGDNGYLELEYGPNNEGSHTSHIDNIKALNEAKMTGLPIVVILLSGRPLLVTDYIDEWDGFIAAWLPGTEGGNGIADVIFGDYDFTGKLPITWPKDNTQFAHSVMMEDYNPLNYQYPYGYGLKYND
ncbi:MAG: beta-N-acetylhexosaminidase [Haloplasmataceae bacterium]|jgi:beta-glucosidase|nr:beta-N-acetylhexosaminidase [Haloplasmataceae bacterium]